MNSSYYKAFVREFGFKRAIELLESREVEINIVSSKRDTLIPF